MTAAAAEADLVDAADAEAHEGVAEASEEDAETDLPEMAPAVVEATAQDAMAPAVVEAKAQDAAAATAPGEVAPDLPDHAEEAEPVKRHRTSSTPQASPHWDKFKKPTRSYFLRKEENNIKKVTVLFEMINLFKQRKSVTINYTTLRILHSRAAHISSERNY